MYWSHAYFRNKNGKILITLANNDDVILQNDDGTWSGTGLEGDQFPTKENITSIVEDLENRLENIRNHADAWFRENQAPSEEH